MDEMTAFERQLASRLERLAGPPHYVDTPAIVHAARSTTGRPRVTAMFSATRFVVAAVIVAVFGGFLVAGVLTTRDGEQLAPAAASPSPTASLLSTLDTEEIRPGVYRVLGDGHRDVRASVWDVAVSTTGDVWIDLVVDGPSRVARLGGEQEYQLSAIEAGTVGTSLSVDRQGDVHALPQGGTGGLVFDGEDWVPAERSLSEGGSGTSDAVEGDGFWASPAKGRGGLEVLRQSADGDEPVYLDLNYTEPVPDLNQGFGLTDAGGAVLAAPASDGTIWVSLSTPGSGRFQLAKFDGMTFDRIDTGGPSGPSRAALRLDDSGQNVLTDIAEAPDGTLWIQRWQRHDDVLYVWTWDGSAWTEYGPVETKAGAAWAEVWASPDGYPGAGPRTGIRFKSDGSIWFDGFVHFDGERFNALDAPVTSADGTTVVSAISAAPDTSIWIVMVGGYGSDDCQTSITCGTSAEGLFVITPDAVAASEQGHGAA